MVSMDPDMDNEDVAPPIMQTEGEVVAVGEKRPVGNGEEDAVKAAKRLKTAEEMQRVAEIVMVLSAMAAMRTGKEGNKSPTDVEVKLVAEARAKLVEICQDLAPKDLVGRDAIGTVIEDLGLNWKVKDQRLGFRTQRLSIKEKLSLSKRKLEDAKIFAATSMVYNSPPPPQVAQMGFGQMHSMRMISADRPSSAALPSGNGSLHPGNGSSTGANAAATAPLMNNMPNVEVRGVGLGSNQLGRDSTAAAAGLGSTRGEKTQAKLEGGPHGALNAQQIQANTSANEPLVNTPNWSIHPHSTSSGKPTSENKVLNHNSAKVEGTSELGAVHRTSSQLARDQTFRPFATQTSPATLPSVHPPMQSVKYVQPSSYFNNHNEIAKVVQKLLQPKLPEHPTWTPPSREYMNKAVACQMCKLATSEVESVVLCDACEKGYHLKCLETVNQKGIPRGEWHCTRCITLSNGKPLPPKYGRVMRSMTPPKGPSNSTGSQTSSGKKVGSADPKVSQEKATPSGTYALQNPAGSFPVGTNNIDSATHSKIPNDTESPGSITSSGKDANEGKYAVTLPDNLMERPTQQTQAFKSQQEERLVLRPNATLPDKVGKKHEDSKLTLSSQDIVKTDVPNSAKVPLKTCEDDPIVDKFKSKADNDSTKQPCVKQNEQDVAHGNSIGNSVPDNVAGEHAGPSSNGFQSVEWIGNAVRAMDGKTFYESCCIHGVTYKLQGHALFHSSHDKLVPSKLQAMWEDIKTGSKWVVVNQCYFPSDLPEAIGHPCTTESNEVYESNHESRVMAGLIQGPCEVLPPAKFKEKSEKRTQLGPEANNGLWPIFLCKWFYDEYKGNFQPVFG